MIKTDKEKLLALVNSIYNDHHQYPQLKLPPIQYRRIERMLSLLIGNAPLEVRTRSRWRMKESGTGDVKTA